MSDEENEEQFARRADNWLKGLSEDRTEAFNAACRHFRPALRRFVENRLHSRLQSQTGASDIMQSAFTSLWKKLEPDNALASGSEEMLWRHLLKIARRRLTRHWRKIYAKKRGSGRELNAASLVDDAEDACFEELVIEATNHQLEVDLIDIVEQLEPELQTIVAMRMASVPVAEIANELKCSKSRVERKIRLLGEQLGRILETD